MQTRENDNSLFVQIMRWGYLPQNRWKSTRHNIIQSQKTANNCLLRCSIMSIGEAHWRCFMYCEAAVMGKIRDLFRICFRKQRYYEILKHKNTLSCVHALQSMLCYLRSVHFNSVHKFEITLEQYKLSFVFRNSYFSRLVKFDVWKSLQSCWSRASLGRQ